MTKSATYTFTHNPQEGVVPPMDDSWRDPAQDQREKPAMPDARRTELEGIAKKADERKKQEKKPSAKFSFFKAAWAGTKFCLDKILVPTAKLTNYAFKESLSFGITAVIVAALYISPELRQDISGHFQQASRTYFALTHESPRPLMRPDDLGAPTRPVARPTP